MKCIWLAFFLLVSAEAASPEWTQWAGPNGNFTVDAKGIAGTWPAGGPKQLWKRKLGEGYAKNELDAQLGAFENLQSRACRSVFGLGAKSRDELKALGIDLTNARQASFQDHKSGLASDPNEAVIRWGRMKGMKVSEIADTDLSYYLNAEKKSLAAPEKAKYKKSIEAMITALETEIAKRAKVAEGNPELDSLLIHIREECAALGVPEDKVEAGIKSATTVDIAKKWLEQLRARRKKAADEAAAPEPGSRG